MIIPINEEVSFLFSIKFISDSKKANKEKMQEGKEYYFKINSKFNISCISIYKMIFVQGCWFRIVYSSNCDGEVKARRWMSSGVIGPSKKRE